MRGPASRLRALDLARPIGGFAYAVAAMLVIAAQYAAVAAVLTRSGQPVRFDPAFWLHPLRQFLTAEDLSEFELLAALALSLAAAAALALMSLRRAATIGRGYLLAVLATAPILQVPAVLVLTALPPRTASDDPEPGDRTDAASIVQGMLSGMALIVFAVFVSTAVFGVYGWGLFLLTPCLVGATTAYVANRRAALSGRQTMRLVTWALAAGAAALVALGLEGLVCIVLAAPLALAMAALGALIGRGMALKGRAERPAVMSVAVLPLVFALEAALPPAVVLDTHEVLDIAAPPAQVWTAVTRMGEIGDAPGPLFRLGLAYPVRSELKGEGVGAERIGVFSTGEARERITVWSPERRLEFVVLENPPLMDEFSPHEVVHAPHVEGYFETAWTRFELDPLPDGRTRLTERASHTLRLDPVLYWAPIVRWGIDRNNARVLKHIRSTAEAMHAAEASARAE